jgi:N-acetylglutamate synthase-like GNAT family acetyltransferase
MDRHVLLLDKNIYGEYLKGLILPEAWEKLEKEETFLVGALEDEIPVGAALWELETTSARLLSIAVENEHRRRGIGTALLRYSMKVLHQLICDGIYAITLPEEEAAARLLESYGMTSEAEASASFKTTLEDVEKVKYLQGKNSHTIALEEVSQSNYNYFLNQYVSMDNRLFQKELFEQTCSRFIVREQQIVAGIFVEKEESGLSVAWLHSATNKAEDLIYLLQDAVGECTRIYPKDTVIRFTCYSDALLKIIHKLFDGKIEFDLVQMWSMSDGKFRLAETSMSEWEKGE